MTIAITIPCKQSALIFLLTLAFVQPALADRGNAPNLPAPEPLLKRSVPNNLSGHNPLQLEGLVAKEFKSEEERVKEKFKGKSLEELEKEARELGAKAEPYRQRANNNTLSKDEARVYEDLKRELIDHLREIKRRKQARAQNK